MHSYKELKVWQQSVDLAEVIYKLTKAFPDSEKFGLTSQMRRCSVSIASNIAEGAGRNSPKEFAVFLGYAYGSSCELETQMLIANKIDLIDKVDKENFDSAIESIQKMIFSLKKTLK